jgi:isopenicillin N synthase-like dioxygenase
MIDKTKIENIDFTSIPIIDLSLLDTNPTLFLESLKNAVINIGFFYIKSHKVDKKLLEKMKNYTILFFDLPSEEKIKLNRILTPSFLGYGMLGTETNNNKKTHGREQFNFSNEINKKEEKILPVYYKLYSPGLWPDENILPGFKETFLEYINIINNLGKDLLCFISESLGLPKYSLIEYMNEESFCSGKIIKYQNIDELNNNQGIGLGAHKDTSGLLTILFPFDHLPGLQVQNHSGEWIDVPKIDDTFIVNLGFPLEYILKGTVVATTHRVFNPPFGMGTRYSLPVFITHRYNKPLYPINLPKKIEFKQLKQKNIISDADKYKEEFEEIFNDPGNKYLERRVNAYPKLAKIYYSELNN